LNRILARIFGGLTFVGTLFTAACRSCFGWHGHPARDSETAQPSKRPIPAWLIKLAAAVIIIGGIVAFYIMFINTHMRNQPNLRTYKFEMPPMPANVLPVKDAYPQPPTAEQAESLRNPVQYSPEALARGKIYYQYYCLFCHGETGSGFGPVGFSYNPVPADLRADKFASYSDGQLLRASLTGTGHDPMLKRIIPPEYWWHIVLYTRELNRLKLPDHPKQTTSAIEPNY
jgi:hypothetical protein